MIVISSRDLATMSMNETVDREKEDDTMDSSHSCLSNHHEIQEIEITCSNKTMTEKQETGQSKVGDEVNLMNNNGERICPGGPSRKCGQMVADQGHKKTSGRDKSGDPM